MLSRSLIVFCVSALFLQSISAQYLSCNQAGASNLAATRPWAGLSSGGLQGTVGNGGGLTVSSTSPIAPTGVTIVSNNAIEGPVEIIGEIPLLSAVALEGPLATQGAAGTTYSCGNGEVGITADSLAAAEVGANNAGFIGNDLNGIGVEINGIGAGINGFGAKINGIGASGTNARLLNAGIGNTGLNLAGYNGEIAGARLGRSGGGIY